MFQLLFRAQKRQLLPASPDLRLSLNGAKITNTRPMGLINSKDPSLHFPGRQHYLMVRLMSRLSRNTKAFQSHNL